MGLSTSTTELPRPGWGQENIAVGNRRRFLAELAGFLAIAGGFVASEAEDMRQGSHPAAPVDINRATIDELMRVPGMTRTWAARVVRFRPYRMKTDLLDRGVVTSEVYARIKDYVIAHRLAQ